MIHYKNHGGCSSALHCKGRVNENIFYFQEENTKNDAEYKKHNLMIYSIEIHICCHP